MRYMMLVCVDPAGEQYVPEEETMISALARRAPKQKWIPRVSGPVRTTRKRSSGRRLARFV
jgi:hypothetical protein